MDVRVCACAYVVNASWRGNEHALYNFRIEECFNFKFNGQEMVIKITVSNFMNEKLVTDSPLEIILHSPRFVVWFPPKTNLRPKQKWINKTKFQNKIIRKSDFCKIIFLLLSPCKAGVSN